MTNSNETRVQGIEKLGYTRQEAAFLATVALHGGYFMRRQYCQFVGVKSGKRAASFVAKLLDRGHARRYRFALHRAVLHLGYKPIYDAIGEPESRNRREHQASSIESRLMAIDYVLSHFDFRFLATRADRNRMLLQFGVAREELPLVHRFPIRMLGDLVVFAFIDCGFATDSAFVHFLRAYRGVFDSLPEFQLDFVGTRESNFLRARSVVERVLLGDRERGLDAAALDRLLQHFADRQAYESHETKGFDRARIDRLRDELDEFGSPLHQSLFATWKAGGRQAVTREVGVRRAPRWSFRAVELPFTYRLFSRLEAA